MWFTLGAQPFDNISDQTFETVKAEFVFGKSPRALRHAAEFGWICNQGIQVRRPNLNRSVLGNQKSCLAVVDEVADTADIICETWAAGSQRLPQHLRHE